MDVIVGVMVGLAVGWLIAQEYERRIRRGAPTMVKVGDTWWIYVKGTGWVDTVPGSRVRNVADRLYSPRTEDAPDRPAPRGWSDPGSVD